MPASLKVKEPRIDLWPGSLHRWALAHRCPETCHVSRVKSPLFSGPQFPFQFNEWSGETGQGLPAGTLNQSQAKPERTRVRQEAGGGTGLQRPGVAQRAVKFSPDVFTLWPCPKRIPKRARPLHLVSFQGSFGRRISPVGGRRLGTKDKGRTSFLHG